jgi:MerR family redox-sensitive transcriptional activator SoxR
MRSVEDPLLTISTVAQRSGIAASALRFYESRGLIESVRTGAGHRRYRRSTLRRIAFIVFAQRVGLTLDEVAEQLALLPSDHPPTAKDWQHLSRVWKTRIEQRMTELNRLYDSLDQCIGCGCLSLKHCKLINPDDEARRAGPGPRLWVGGKS